MKSYIIRRSFCCVEKIGFPRVCIVDDRMSDSRKSVKVMDTWRKNSDAHKLQVSVSIEFYWFTILRVIQICVFF